MPGRGGLRTISGTTGACRTRRAITSPASAPTSSPTTSSKRAAPEIYAAAEIPLNIPAGPRRMDSATMLALREQRDAQQPGITPTVLAGTVVRMDPIPDGSTSEPPIQVASLGPVVRMDPIPDGSTSAPPAPRGEVVRMEPIPNPPVAEPVASPRVAEPMPPPRSVAPSRAAAPPARTQVAALALPPAAPPTRPTPAVQSGPARGFALLGTAQASTLPNAAIRPAVARGPAPAATLAGGWAVQVGAFANPTQARGAAVAAQDAAGGRSSVQPVTAGRATLYRARVTGLSQPAAQAACDRLKRKGACIVLSPDAQG
ncbi:SPOR domain-containing protein [Dankookia sp. P2]|uniref:SPOR domain-containing protein n=1 Tax=Dankookia sp. P2 TaxID=3423955 RepID=UPI003D663DB6